MYFFYWRVIYIDNHVIISVKPLSVKPCNFASPCLTANNSGVVGNGILPSL